MFKCARPHSAFARSLPFCGNYRGHLTVQKDVKRRNCARRAAFGAVRAAARSAAAPDTTFAASSADPTDDQCRSLRLFGRVRNRLAASRYVLAGTCDRIAARQHNGQSQRQHCDLCHFPLHASVICSCTTHLFAFPSRHDDASRPQHEITYRDLRHGYQCLSLSTARVRHKVVDATWQPRHETSPCHRQYTYIRCPPRMPARREGRVIYITSTGRQYLNNNSRNYLILAIRLHSYRNRMSISPVFAARNRNDALDTDPS